MNNYLALDLPDYSGIYNPLSQATGWGNKNAWQTLQSAIDWGLKAFYIGVIVYSFMNLVMGGLSWIRSEGDKEKLKKAQEKIKVAVIGFVLTMLIFAGMYLMRGIFGTPFGLKERVACHSTEEICRQNCPTGTCDFEPACGRGGSNIGFVCRP